MAKRKIIVNDESMLKRKSREVTAFDSRLGILIDDMAETMYAAEGVGLAAPQVGILKRVVVIDVGDGLIELVNPVIVEKKGNQYSSEGCLSFPNEFGMVNRPAKVKVKAVDRNGNEFTVRGEELLARAFCHEIDHLNGIVFKDLATEMIDPDREK